MSWVRETNAESDILTIRVSIVRIIRIIIKAHSKAMKKLINNSVGTSTQTWITRKISAIDNIYETGYPNERSKSTEEMTVEIY